MDQEAQEDELLALASIYDEETFAAAADGDTHGGQFAARMELPGSAFHVNISRQKHDLDTGWSFSGYHRHVNLEQ